MTVVSALYFDENFGAVVADEQSSTHARKLDIANKIAAISVPCPAVMIPVTGYSAEKPHTELSSPVSPINCIMAGTGTSDILNVITRNTQYAVQQNLAQCTSKEDIVELIGQVMGNVRRQFTDNFLFSQFGLYEADFQVGKRALQDKSVQELTPRMIGEYESIVKNPAGPLGFLINNEFLVLGSDKNGAQIYRILMNLLSPIPVARPYESVGSGADVAEIELAAFVESFPREKRRNIGKVKGISALLQATDSASERNQGVGGTPMVGIIDEGKIIIPPSNNTTLAIEVVYGKKNGFLRQGFLEEALTSLLFKGQDYLSIEEQMWKEASNKEQFSRALRGYK